MDMQSELVWRILLGFLMLAGTLIGIIWMFMREEAKSIKDSIKELQKNVAKIPIFYVTKRDCEHVSERKADKKNT